jgi:hypothetical protein
MTELRKAAEIALEEFELFFNTYPYMEKGYTLDARKALRQALAQPNKEWVGLTDQEIWDLGADHAIDLAWAREIEAKLKEKNV